MGNFEKDHDLTDSKYLKRPSSYFPFLKKPLNIILRRFCVRVGACEHKGNHEKRLPE